MYETFNYRSTCESTSSGPGQKSRWSPSHGVRVTVLVLLLLLAFLFRVQSLTTVHNLFLKHVLCRSRNAKTKKTTLTLKEHSLVKDKQIDNYNMTRHVLNTEMHAVGARRSQLPCLGGLRGHGTEPARLWPESFHPLPPSSRQ